MIEEDNEELEKEWVAIGPKCWGRGKFEDDAITVMCENLPRLDRFEGKVKVTLLKVKGFKGVDALGGVSAKEFNAEYRHEVPVEKLQKIEDILVDLEMAVEEVSVSIREEGEERQVE